MNRYKTVARKAVGETIEKKSKFIAHVSPASSEEEAAEFIGAIKKKHYNATHNVFAYRIGLKSEFEKASDDGEPSGTAGAPILDILRKEQIKNCAVVVTRYFGGTLLGTGGLVRAYSKAAKEGLLAANIIDMVYCVEYDLTVDYHTYGKVRYEIEKEQFIINDVRFTDNVTFRMLIENERKERFLELVKEWCGGRNVIEEISTDYFEGVPQIQ